MFKLFKKKKSNPKIENTEDIAVLVMSTCVNSVVAVCDCRPGHVEYPDYVTTTFQYDGMEFELNITFNPIMSNGEK